MIISQNKHCTKIVTIVMKIFILVLLFGFTYSTQIFCSDTTDLSCYSIDRGINLWRLKDTGSTSVAERGSQISKIKSYPNPSKEEIIFSVNLFVESDCIITIEDINGRRIKSFSNITGQIINELVWDLKNDDGYKVVTGTYFLKIWSSKDIFTHKFIIEK